MEVSGTMVSVAVNGEAMPAYLVEPRGAGPYPAVVVVMEAFGLNGHIKRVAERLAAEGYVVLAPDLYHRIAPNTVVPYDNVPEAIRLLTSLRDDDIVRDMNAAIGFLQKLPEVKRDRIGVTGFCMGGRVTFLTACRNPNVRAAVAFYGGGIASVMNPNDQGSKAPLDYAEQLRGAILLFFGEADPLIPMEDVRRIEARLKELGKQADVVVYPGAPHGFFCDERDSYRPDAAADAWKRLLEFFARHL
ncbi:MAG: dienelactone hydrolase family protein [Candidatus Binatia bacterium]|nr:dienelactone hydrolase family protein [Candidatus Binatia bacterium]